ncbi:MAG: hypothetical protein QF440_02655 [Candidatus Thalassarchaeaceae archaeon]|nr:hypothetical protein [Candidatus Thalassarchaeaceae archaeon]
MRKAMIFVLIMLVSIIPIQAKVYAESYSTAKDHEFIHLSSQFAPGAVLLFDENGTIFSVNAHIPIDLQLEPKNWTLVRMFDGVPQVERMHFNSDKNVTSFLNITIENPLEIDGLAHINILGPIAEITPSDAIWNSSTSIPNTLGHPGLPNAHLGITSQIEIEFENNFTAFESWVVTNTSVGCCSYDRTEMTVQDLEITVNAPTLGLNGSWGWSTIANLTGQGDGRSTRLLWVPITGELIDSTDLRITLPTPHEIRFSPQEQYISGLPYDFTIHRGEIPVTGNVTIALGHNSPPTSYFSSQNRQIPFLPIAGVSYIDAQCDDNSITKPSSRFVLRNGNQTMLDESVEVLPIDPIYHGITPGSTLNLTLECTDPQGLMSNFSVDLYFDGIPPSRMLNMQYLHPEDGVPVDISHGQTEFSIPSGSVISGSVQSTDESTSAVDIIWTSNKTSGWKHEAMNNMAWNDLFVQGPQINGQHLSVEERHQEKPLTVYHLQLNLSDAAGNSLIQSWDVTVTDRTPPHPRPALSIDAQYYGELNHPIEGGSNVDVDLSQSWDDISAITALSWEVSLNGEPLDIGTTWEDVETFALPTLPSGRHVLVVNATDAAGNIGTHSSLIEVEPPVGPFFSIVDVVVIGNDEPGEPGVLDITIENSGQGEYELRICYLETCTVNLTAVQATVNGPANMTHRIAFEEWNSGEVTIRLEIEDGTVIEHDTGIRIEAKLSPLHWLLLLAPLLCGLCVLWYVGSKDRGDSNKSD